MKNGLPEERSGIGAIRATARPTAFEIPVMGLMHRIDVTALKKVAVVWKNAVVWKKKRRRWRIVHGLAALHFQFWTWPTCGRAERLAKRFTIPLRWRGMRNRWDTSGSGWRSITTFRAWHVPLLQF